MELYQIRYFLAVADTLNFTRAAERSFVSQPALTKAIQRLEESLGGRLFERSKTQVQLTSLGQTMLPNFRQIFDNAMQAREQARRCVSGNAKRLGAKINVGGASQFPEPGDPSLSVRGGTPPPGSGLTGQYQVYYRNAAAVFCPPATFNVSSGVQINW